MSKHDRRRPRNTPQTRQASTRAIRSTSSRSPRPAELDGRFLPGREEEFFAEIDRLLGSAVSREFIHHDIAVETTADGDL